MTSKHATIQDELMLCSPAHTTQHLRSHCGLPTRCAKRQLLRTQAGYRWSAGAAPHFYTFSISLNACPDTCASVTHVLPLCVPTKGNSSRRLREGLLDNVDPAAPAESADNGWRPVLAPQPDLDDAPSASNGSSSAAGGRPQRSSWPDAPQECPTTSGRPGAAPREGTSSNGAHTSSSGGSNGARPADIGGWGVGANPLPDDWGWPQLGRGGSKGAGAWAGLSGARPQPGSHKTSASADQGGNEENGAGAPEEAWEPAGEVQWDAEEGPDIVELRLQEVVRPPLH